MPKICYEPRTFYAKSREIIDKANLLIADYQARGYDLTLRQLYYQLVSKNIINPS